MVASGAGGGGGSGAGGSQIAHGPAATVPAKRAGFTVSGGETLHVLVGGGGAGTPSGAGASGGGGGGSFVFDGTGTLLLAAGGGGGGGDAASAGGNATATGTAGYGDGWGWRSRGDRRGRMVKAVRALMENGGGGGGTTGPGTNGVGTVVGRRRRCRPRRARGARAGPRETAETTAALADSVVAVVVDSAVAVVVDSAAAAAGAAMPIRWGWWRLLQGGDQAPRPAQEGPEAQRSATSGSVGTDGRVIITFAGLDGYICRGVHRAKPLIGSAGHAGGDGDGCGYESDWDR